MTASSGLQRWYLRIPKGFNESVQSLQDRKWVSLFFEKFQKMNNGHEISIFTNIVQERKQRQQNLGHCS